MHLYCEGLAPRSPAHNNWWGLEFYNASHYLDREGSIRINESSSMLHFVDIEFAGVSPKLNAVPAVRASPTAPHLLHVRLQHNALDATNYTELRSSAIVHDTISTNNRGHGFVVETHLGRVSITDSFLEGNAGNGLKGKFLDGRYIITNYAYTFCNRPTGGSNQLFPQLITGVPLEYPYTSCQTVNKLYMLFYATET